MTDRRLVRRVLRTFRPYRRLVTVVGLLILVTAGLGVVNPVLIQVVFDRALFPPEGGPDMALLWTLAAIMAAITVLSGVLGIAQTYITNEVGQRVMRDLRDRLYRHLQRLSLRFFTETRTGEVQSRIADDVGGVQTVVTNTATNVISNGVIFLSTLVAMLLLSWELTLVAVGTVPLFALASGAVGKRRRAVAAKVQRSAAEVSAITQETLSVSGIMLAKLFGRQRHEIDRFSRENQNLSELSVKRQMTGQAFFTMIQIFFSLAPVAAYILAGYLLSGSGSGITAGTIVAFTTLQARLLFPIGMLLNVSVEMQSSLALFERIFGYLDIEPEIVDSPNAVDLDPKRVPGRVVFDRVRLRYSPASNDEKPDGKPVGPEPQWALDGVSFEIEPGQLAAFVGPSGAGKTSISYLIPRLYDPTGGRVLIDGVEVRDIRLASLADIVGYVSQDSLRRNLLYGNPDATQEELEAAARAAFIHDRIMELPDGYDTVVGERGYRMSGGERQRLAIARVILHQPRVLVLDEATSALDTTSERYVQGALEPLMRGRTTIAIAHRLSTIIAADFICVVDRGRIVERGSHRELLERGGLYAELYLQQFAGGSVEARCEDGVILSDGTVVPNEAQAVGAPS